MSIFKIELQYDASEQEVSCEEFGVQAESHIAHVWYETTLLGVSAAGKRRLDAASKKTGAVIRTKVHGNAVRVVGWE